MAEISLILKHPSELMKDFNARIAEACKDVPVSDATIDMAPGGCPLVTLIAADEFDEAGEPVEVEGLIVEVVSVSALEGKSPTGQKITGDDRAADTEQRIEKVMERAQDGVQDVKFAREGDKAYVLISYYEPGEDAQGEAEIKPGDE